MKLHLLIMSDKPNVIIKLKFLAKILKILYPVKVVKGKRVCGRESLYSKILRQRASKPVGSKKYVRPVYAFFLTKTHFN